MDLTSTFSKLKELPAAERYGGNGWKYVETFQQSNFLILGKYRVDSGQTDNFRQFQSELGLERISIDYRIWFYGNTLPSGQQVVRSTVDRQVCDK